MRIKGTSQAIGRARQLRRQLTKPERLLWSALQGDKTGARFRCQYPAGPYVLDFYCARARLCVEVDGGTHELTYDADQQRDSYLRRLGVHTLRIPVAEIINNLDGVVRMIAAEVALRTPASALLR